MIYLSSILTSGNKEMSLLLPITIVPNISIMAKNKEIKTINIFRKTVQLCLIFQKYLLYAAIICKKIQTSCNQSFKQ